MKLVDVPSFPYRGGKSRLRNFIIRWLPLTGSTYMEPFVGRGNVFFMVKAACNYNNYVINDINTSQFFDAINHYDGSKLPHIEKSQVSNLKNNNTDLYSLLEPIITWNTSPIGHKKHDLNTYKNNLLYAKKLLENTTLYSMDAIQLLESYQLDNNSFVYLDPPYLNGNVGIYKSTDFDRTMMIEILKHAKYRWALSEYECSDLNKAFGRPKIAYNNVYVSPKPGIQKRSIEVLYTNYPIDNGPNIIDFGYANTMHISRHAMKIFNNYPMITKDYFTTICPVAWSKRRISIEFELLTKYPIAYFDGHILYNISLISEWPPDINNMNTIQSIEFK